VMECERELASVCNGGKAQFFHGCYIKLTLLPSRRR
jgi:hypothetical protein